MNIKDLLMRYRLPLFENEGGSGGSGGSGGGEGGGEGGGSDAGAGGSDAGSDAGSQGGGDDSTQGGRFNSSASDKGADDGDDASDKDAASSDDADDGKGEGSDSDDKDDAGSDADADDGSFKVAIPEGFEEHSEQFESFQTDMDAWLKANPDATPQQALQEAANRQANIVKSDTEKVVSDFNAQIEGWESSAKSDPEIGGDKFEENLANAKLAIETFGSPELGELLNSSGLGSHPEVIRFAMKASKSIADATMVGTGDAGGGSGQDRSLSSRYPTSKPKG